MWTVLRPMWVILRQIFDPINTTLRILLIPNTTKSTDLYYLQAVQWEEEHVWPFLVVVQLIHRLTSTVQQRLACSFFHCLAFNLRNFSTQPVVDTAILFCATPLQHPPLPAFLNPLLSQLLTATKHLEWTTHY